MATAPSNAKHPGGPSRTGGRREGHGPRVTESGWDPSRASGSGRPAGSASTPHRWPARAGTAGAGLPTRGPGSRGHPPQPGRAVSPGTVGCLGLLRTWRELHPAPGRACTWMATWAARPASPGGASTAQLLRGAGRSTPPHGGALAALRRCQALSKLITRAAPDNAGGRDSQPRLTEKEARAQRS